MVRIIMHGCNGRMGQMISGIVAEDTEAEIVAGIDITGEQLNNYPVYKDINECDIEADAVIDFAAAAAVDSVVKYCVDKKIALVECTTGLTEEQTENLKAASKDTAVLRSANMSLGINTLQKALTEVTKKLCEAGFDVEIVEKHHKMKLDAPSGTALALADTVNEAMDNQYHYVYDRSQVRQKRDAKEIGISAVRGGTIVGDHDVIFAGQDEVITFSHVAYSRAVFGKGAVEAAKYLKGKSAGLYTMSDVIG